MVKILKGNEVPAEHHKNNLGRLDQFGREIPDGRPMQPPLGYKPSPSLAETIRDMVYNAQIQRELEAQGVETFEESEDFDVGDDYDPTSPYEEYFEPTPLEELIRRQKAGEPLSDTIPSQTPSDGAAGPVTEPPSGGATGGGKIGP